MSQTGAALGPTAWGADPEFYGPRHVARLRLLARLLGREVAPGARVLDVGAGAGRLANLLACGGFAVVGVEPSVDFVAHATARAHAGVRFLVGDALALPFGDASFDAAVAGEVLEHLARDDVAVGELFRVLVPGGICVVSVPADAAHWDFSDDWAGHLRRYAPQDLVALFTRAGFDVVRVARWGFPFVRLYHVCFYLPVLRRKRSAGDRLSPAPGLLRRLVSGLLACLFAVDGLLLGAPGGLGLVLVARKPG